MPQMKLDDRLGGLGRGLLPLLALVASVDALREVAGVSQAAIKSLGPRLDAIEASLSLFEARSQFMLDKFESLLPSQVVVAVESEEDY